MFPRVDLDYFDELQGLHNDNLLAAEKIKVSKEILPEYQLQIIENNGFSLVKNKKLTPNPGNERKYKLRYQNLKLYLKLRSKLKKLLEC